MDKLKLCFYCFLLFVFSSVLIAEENNKASLDSGGRFMAKPALVWQCTNRTDADKMEEGDDFSALIYQLALQYKYRALDKFYGYLNVNYGEGTKNREDGDYRLQNWGAEFALGYTFGFLNGLISPFLAFGYNSLMDKRTSSVSDWGKYDSRQIKFLTSYCMLGAETQHLLCNSFSLGLLAGIGMYINPKLKYQIFHVNPSDPNGTILKERFSFGGEEKLFCRMGANLIYHWCAWRFGLELAYHYLPVRAKDNDEDLKLHYNINQFVLAFVVGFPF